MNNQAGFCVVVLRGSAGCYVVEKGTSVT